MGPKGFFKVNGQNGPFGQLVIEQTGFRQTDDQFALWQFTQGPGEVPYFLGLGFLG